MQNIYDDIWELLRNQPWRLELWWLWGGWRTATEEAVCAKHHGRPSMQNINDEIYELLGGYSWWLHLCKTLWSWDWGNDTEDIIIAKCTRNKTAASGPQQNESRIRVVLW
jgi:hypothetical protein